MTDPREDLEDGKLLREIAAQCLLDSDQWFPGKLTNDIGFLALCMSGEAGEVNNKVKKVLRGDRTMDEQRDAIVEEIVDVFTYMMNLVGVLEFDLYAEYLRKRSFNHHRWGPATREKLALLRQVNKVETVGPFLDYEGRAMRVPDENPYGS